MRVPRKKTNKRSSIKGALLLLIALLTSGSVYAWTSYTDWKKNHLQSDIEKVPSIVIQGNFNKYEPTKSDVLMLNQQYDKQVTVLNNGETAVFIRVSVQEHFLPFVIDTKDKTGNGHIKKFKELGNKGEIHKQDVETWREGARLAETDKIYIEGLKPHHYEVKLDNKKRPREMEAIQLTWGRINPLEATDDSYWLYEENLKDGKGYYFYAKPLLPNETTEVLLKDMSVRGDAPNAYKGALHQFNIEADAGVIDKGVFPDWNIPETTDNKVYQQFIQAINAKNEEVAIK